MRDYLALLARPVVRRLVLSVLPARLGYSMVTLTIFFYVHEVTGSLSKAGLAIGATSISSSLTTGPRGSLIDRVGQTKPLMFFVPLYVSALLALSFAKNLFALITIAALLGLVAPPINISARPLWKVILSEKELRTGYALDSISINTTSVVGPTLATTISLGVGGSWALRLIALAMAVGGSLLIAMPLSRTWKREEKDSDGDSLFRSPAIRLMAADGLIFGLGNGIYVVGIPAAATLIKRPELTAPMLSACAFAAIIGGVVAGLMSKRMTALGGMLRTYFGISVVMLPLPWAQPGWQMGLILVGLGLFLGMGMVFHWEVIEAVRPRGTAVGALAWLWTVEGSAGALGSAVGGFVIEHFGITPALAITVVMFVLAAVVVYTGRGLLSAADQLPSDENVAEALADTTNPPA